MASGSPSLWRKRKHLDIAMAAEEAGAARRAGTTVRVHHMLLSKYYNSACPDCGGQIEPSLQLRYSLHACRSRITHRYRSEVDKSQQILRLTSHNAARMLLIY